MTKVYWFAGISWSLCSLVLSLFLSILFLQFLLLRACVCVRVFVFFFLLGIWVWFCNKWRKWDGGFVRVNYVSHQKKYILCFLTQKHNLNSLRKWDNFNSQFKQWILLICFQINFFKKKHKKKLHYKSTA
jgi:hypothetical protein